LPTEPNHRPHRGHERSDASIRVVLALGAGLLLLVIVVHPLLALVFDRFNEREQRNDAVRTQVIGEEIDEPQTFPSPRLQTTPMQDLTKFRAGEKEILDSYAFDRQGLIRIPIERAMDLIAERGLPAPKQSTPEINSDAPKSKGEARPPRQKADTPEKQPDDSPAEVQQK